MRKCVLQTLQALWQVAPPGSTSGTKACVNLPQAGGLVLRAWLCPAFFPLEVAGTGASGHLLPTPQAFAADPVSLPGGCCFSSQWHCHLPTHPRPLGMTPLPLSLIQSPWPFGRPDGPFPGDVSASLHLPAPAWSGPSLFLSRITAAASSSLSLAPGSLTSNPFSTLQPTALSKL